MTDLGLPSERIEELSVEGRGEIWRCEWARRDSSREPGLYTFTVYPTGDPLAKAYQDHNSRRGESDTVWRFEEHTVRELPAMARFTGEGDHGCELIVGAGHGQGFTLWAGATSVPDVGMCQRLVTAAELVIDAVRR